MRLDRRFAIVVGCSLLWGLLVAALFYRVAATTLHGRGPAPGKPLVVAARALPLGDVIRADSIKVIQVPSQLFPKGGFSRNEDVLDRPVVSPIGAEEAVVEARIAARGSGVGLAPMIPPGMRAMSVKVNEVVGVAGFVLPGMRVDVLATGHPPERNDTVTATVLQNVPVLSAGQTIQSDSKGQPISTTVVTLLVTPGQAEALTLSNSEGHIQLVLRNSTDQEILKTPGRQLRDLYSVDRPPAVAEPVKSPEAPRVRRSQPLPPDIVAVPSMPAIVSTPMDEVLMIRGNLKTLERANPRVTK